ncbi:carbon monoxide dehydrogenase [Jiangella aurantiaca]|uniref:Carbon monoxide dehydrogenase n=1 Tax=Jiangella aurantiaca TaxID=2530373 RepID=A0A4R5AK49_9ACTN|nr:carbon monoxide dehydrogenase subunit G [Jiangella aurantiaca]TDD71364.1 carbon monoxide dehydrogenase [Jiangella aurantiaca]
MKVTGTAVLHAPRDEVWKALNDPAVLVRTIPGCHRLEEAGPDRYKMTVTAGVGSIKGTYAGDVALHDQQEPASFVMTASGAGAPGTVSADVRVRLTEDGSGTTRLDYDADAIVGGMIGGVGQRMLAGVAKKTAGEFFAAVDDVLTGAAAAPAAAVPERAAGSSAEPQVPVASAPGVYEAPLPARVSAAAPADFMRGVLVGAAVALAGVALGGWLAGRSRPR